VKIFTVRGAAGGSGGFPQPDTISTAPRENSRDRNINIPK
jgi:hypothetical protein